MTSHARRRIFLVVTLVLWGLLTHGTYAGTGDEPHYGAVALARTNRALLLRLAVVAGCYLLPVALPITNVHGWTGGWSPPARFIVPIIPLLALAVAAGMRAMPRPLMASIVAVQIGINAYAWQHPKILWNDGDGRAAACSRTGARFCDYLPSFVHRG